MHRSISGLPWSQRSVVFSQNPAWRGMSRVSVDACSVCVVNHHVDAYQTEEFRAFQLDRHVWMAVDCSGMLQIMGGFHLTTYEGSWPPCKN